MTLALALDTATEYVAAGLAEVDPATGAFALLVEETPLAPRAANSRALPLVRSLLARASRHPAEIGVVVVGRGPGSFTGVRIGMATAKGVAQGLGVPLVAVPTLDAVALGALRAAGGEGATVAVIGDAMRGEVYATRYRRASGGGPERLDPFAAEKPAAVAARLAALGEPLVLAGNGLAKYRDVFGTAMGSRATFLEEAFWRPSAEGLFAAAARAVVVSFADPARFDAGLALPIYTRLSDAEEDEAVRDGREPGAVPSSGVAGPDHAGDQIGPVEAGWPLAARSGR